MSPRVFISYSRTSPAHQELIRSWADRLIADGVEVIFDLYDLHEGNDKHAFMERMVTDQTVTHVLVFSDLRYAERADAREAGVGTESQIISQEVYSKIEQSKFIPIACEIGTDGLPCMPTFLKSRIYIDFTSPEVVNEHWERLIRLLYGKPQIEKPKLGKAPAYLESAGTIPSVPGANKLLTLRQALLSARPGVEIYRRDFLDACIVYAEELRVRNRLSSAITGERVLEDCSKLRVVRNLVTDWLLLEAPITKMEVLRDELLPFLETLRSLKGRPPGMNQWNDVWFEAHALFVYETFLYVVAALLKSRNYALLHEVLSARYMLPETDRYGAEQFATYKTFFATSEMLQSVLAAKGHTLYSPAAALVKRQAERSDIPFERLTEADAVLLLYALVSSDVDWFPQLLLYLPYGKVPELFARAAQHRHFQALATITFLKTGGEVREAFKAGRARLELDRWHMNAFESSFAETLNLERLDTI